MLVQNNFLREKNVNMFFTLLHLHINLHRYEYDKKNKSINKTTQKDADVFFKYNNLSF